MYLGRGCVSLHGLGQGVWKEVWTGGCVDGGVYGQCTLPPAEKMVTDAVGTHPTGIHSCINKKNLFGKSGRIA